MPTKKKTSTARKPARKTSAKKSAASGVSAMAAAQLKQFRKTVDQLKGRLEKEVKARGAAAALVNEAKMAREALMGQIKSLRVQGAELTKALKKALSDSDKREAARRQAVERMSELRAELAHRTEELKRKSEELRKLAVDSATRAKDIIMSERSPASAAPVIETDSVSAETERREESPDESSIEEELHPERKE